MSLACWVGIPVYYLVLMLHFNYYRLTYQSRELLSPLLAGLESLSLLSSFNGTF